MTGYVITNLAVFTVIIAYHNQTGAEEIARLPRHVATGRRCSRPCWPWRCSRSPACRCSPAS